MRQPYAIDYAAERARGLCASLTCVRPTWLGNVLPAVLMVMATALTGGRPLPAAEPVAKNEAPRERIRQRDRLLQEAKQLQTAGKLDEAVGALEKALAFHRQVFADTGKGNITILKDLASLHLKRGDFTAARGAREEVLAAIIKQFGEQHWNVTDARQALTDVNFRSKLGRDELQELSAAAEANRQAGDACRKGQFNQAIEWALKDLEINKRLRGEQHPYYATRLNILAEIYQAAGDYSRAEPGFTQVTIPQLMYQVE